MLSILDFWFFLFLVLTQGWAKRKLQQTRSAKSQRNSLSLFFATGLEQKAPGECGENTFFLSLVSSHHVLKPAPAIKLPSLLQSDHWKSREKTLSWTEETVRGSLLWKEECRRVCSFLFLSCHFTSRYSRKLKLRELHVSGSRNEEKGPWS